MKTHGLFGGWSEDEHKDFLRLFQRCGQSYTKVLSVCMTQMPYFSRDVGSLPTIYFSPEISWRSLISG